MRSVRAADSNSAGAPPRFDRCPFKPALQQLSCLRRAHRLVRVSRQSLFHGWRRLARRPSSIRASSGSDALRRQLDAAAAKIKMLSVVAAGGGLIDRRQQLIIDETALLLVGEDAGL